MGYSVRDLNTYTEMLAVHKLQQKIWGLTDSTFGVYPPLMNTIAHNGGTVLGAFDDNSGELIAFLVGFLGREHGGPLKLCSQVMGVLPEWRRMGVAESLKRAQRERVISQGLPLITWTYDPLEGPNSTLNLHKLRAISRRYLRDVYGSEFGALNAGLPTDRLLVEWWVASNWLNKAPVIDFEEAAPVFVVEGGGTRRVVSANLNLSAAVLLLDTVPDIHAVKAANLSAALDWRLQVRAALEHYFTVGYIATDFISGIDPATGDRQNWLVLQQGTPDLLAEIGIE